MRKNRNSFFTESNMSYQGYTPNMMDPNMPYQAGTSYNSYYAGPNMASNGNEMENRLAKIERQIGRLEHRISKLESTNNTYIDDIDNNGNMYML